MKIPSPTWVHPIECNVVTNNLVGPGLRESNRRLSKKNCDRAGNSLTTLPEEVDPVHDQDKLRVGTSVRGQKTGEPR
jgi:hypothetical protein